MINCFKCKEQISTEARICPKCGQAQFYSSAFIHVMILFIVSFIFVDASMHFLDITSSTVDVYAGVIASVLTLFFYKKRKTLN